MTYSDVPGAVVAELTRSREKVAHYLVDPYFRAGLRRVDLSTVAGLTFVVLKPDAVAGRRLEPALEALRDNDFIVAGAWTFRFTPLLTREVWRYQFNIASWDRAAVVDLLLPSTDSLLLVLRDRTWTPGAQPAASRLSALKGSADPARRRPDDLRSRLNGPTTLFNFLHTADEPADVVRELGLLELATGLSILDSLTGEADPSALVARLHDEVPAHDLDRERSWTRLAARPDYAGIARRRAWRELLEVPPAAGALWDVLSVLTAEIDCNVPGLEPLVPTIGAAMWEVSA
ncbi:hypothetical protein ABZX92_12795 [Lentzea sp. NPDC006480]|uniref:hypothetical protein n=1 Tax=Lentzea sp. NPDC006480 TaxID=3157176 RepID=UPI0033BF316F